MWDKLKKLAGAVALTVMAVLSALFMRKPKWVRQKEQEIKQRDKDIDQAKSQADQTQSDYEEVKQKHGERIEQASKPQDTTPFTDADDAASYIDDLLNRR